MDSVVRALQEILQETVNNASSPLNWVIKKVYYGDPVTIPASDFPCITIQPINSGYNMRGSRYDQKEHTIDIRIVYNQKDYFNTGDVNGISKVTIIEDIIKLVEGTDADHSTADLTVCGAIHNNTTLPYDDGGTTKHAAEIAQVSSVNYSFSNERGFPSFEVSVEVSASIIGNR